MRRLIPDIRSRIAVLVLLVGTAHTPRAAAAPVAIVPERLPGPGSSLTWEGLQYLGADPRGHVFLFRADTFEVYPITDGELSKPRRLQSSRPSGGAVLGAAMGADPGEWLVRIGHSVVHFKDGKDSPLRQLAWKPDSVALVRGVPVVGVMPIRNHKATPGFRGEQDLPLLVELGGSNWSELVAEPFSDSGSKDLRFRMNDLVAHRAVQLASGPRGRFWAANSYAYRLRQFGPAGRPLAEISVGDAIPELGDEERESRKLGADLERQGLQVEKGTVTAFTARRVVYAITVGRDGRLYVLAHPDKESESLALDRYDPVLSVLERVSLSLPAGAGTLGMVAGKDGLYLASSDGQRGRWRISWEALEEAAWERVPGVKVNGVRVEESEGVAEP